MADSIYLTLKGNKQGLISAGCSTYNSIGNRYQKNHIHKIMVYATDYEISRRQNVSHANFIFIKADDKSSPLLLSSIANNELLECEFEYYRIDQCGGLLHYKTIKLTKASIVKLGNIHPDSLIENEMYPKETISLKYESITSNHHAASTSGYSISNNI